MMSRKCKYALKALIRLGKQYGQGNLLTDDIAKFENIPKKFLELILLDLKRGGYVQSKQGIGGGYHLVQEPRTITLAEIYRFFDGAIALQPCVSQKFHEKCEDCRDEENCHLKSAFAAIREQTYQLMSKITLESLLKNPRPSKRKAGRQVVRS
jgi:Rrf2 family protein